MKKIPVFPTSEIARPIGCKPHIKTMVPVLPEELQELAKEFNNTISPETLRAICGVDMNLPSKQMSNWQDIVNSYKP